MAQKKKKKLLNLYFFPSFFPYSLYFVGKGVTYDTGGADIKAGGVMRGMSRDKCGAASVAGFMATVAELQPKHVNVTAILSLVRNSVGSNAYVSDEVIYSRAGLRVLVGNTDAEGRMVMTDPLCECKEMILAERKAGTFIPSRLFTVATLTGKQNGSMVIALLFSMEFLFLVFAENNVINMLFSFPVSKVTPSVPMVLMVSALTTALPVRLMSAPVSRLVDTSWVIPLRSQPCVVRITRALLPDRLLRMLSRPTTRPRP